MTEPRKDGMVPDPSQLAEMQATDARLDRLGRRAPEPEDLDDPVFAALAGLAADVDLVEPGATDEAVARLLEVLDGRPLWVLDGEELSELDAARNMILLDDPAWDARRRQVIDLRRGTGGTDGATEGDEAADTGGDAVAAAPEAPADADAEPAEPAAAAAEAEPAAADAETEPETGTGTGTAAEEREVPVAARAADTDAEPERLLGQASTPVVTPLRGPRVPRPSGPVREEPWERVMRRVSLPVAAAITLFTLGGGVTAALTGDPMAPIEGVSRVVDSIAGSDAGTTYSSLKENLDQARSALASGDVDQAKSLVATTQQGLDEVPAEDQTRLQTEIEAVQEQIARTPVTPTPGPSASASVPPVVPNPSPTSGGAGPTATSEPSPTAEPTEPSTEPSETPSEEQPTPSETESSAAPTVQTTSASVGGATDDADD